MQLTVSFEKSGYADGLYKLSAPGFLLAMLCWANESGALSDWTSFAYMALDSHGRGKFHYTGGRAIPPEATQILVRAVKEDLISWEEACFPFAADTAKSIPDDKEFVSVPSDCLSETEIRFCVMSDLHLSSKTGVLHQAFAHAAQYDALLLAGDMTNDGTSEQHELLKQCVDQWLPDMPVFSVTGNHDIPRLSPEEEDRHEILNHQRFQQWLFERRCRTPYTYQYGPDGAYAVRIGRVEVIGLQAVTDQRKFLFEEGRQLEWLDQHLTQCADCDWRIILCHAPLLLHTPKCGIGKSDAAAWKKTVMAEETEQDQHMGVQKQNHHKARQMYQPYLNRDRQLQELLDRHGNVIFISGHTHLSMNNPEGCVEWDETAGNLYVDDGSIRPTEFLSDDTVRPSQWKQGTFLELTIRGKEVEILTRSVRDGTKHARGYYVRERRASHVQ